MKIIKIEVDELPESCYSFEGNVRCRFAERTVISKNLACYLTLSKDCPPTGRRPDCPLVAVKDKKDCGHWHEHSNSCLLWEGGCPNDTQCPDYRKFDD